MGPEILRLSPGGGSDTSVPGGCPPGPPSQAVSEIAIRCHGAMETSKNSNNPGVEKLGNGVWESKKCLFFPALVLLCPFPRQKTNVNIQNQKPVCVSQCPPLDISGGCEVTKEKASSSDTGRRLPIFLFVHCCQSISMHDYGQPLCL